jgi:hypothetical protein
MPRSSITIIRWWRAKRIAKGIKAPRSDQRSESNVLNFENAIPDLNVRIKDVTLPKFPWSCDGDEKEPTTPLHAGRLKPDQLRSFG